MISQLELSLLKVPALSQHLDFRDYLILTETSKSMKSALEETKRIWVGIGFNTFEANAGVEDVEAVIFGANHGGQEKPDGYFARMYFINMLHFMKTVRRSSCTAPYISVGHLQYAFRKYRHFSSVLCVILKYVCDIVEISIIALDLADCTQHGVLVPQNIASDMQNVIVEVVGSILRRESLPEHHCKVHTLTVQCLGQLYRRPFTPEDLSRQLSTRRYDEELWGEYDDQITLIRICQAFNPTQVLSQEFQYRVFQILRYAAWPTTAHGAAMLVKKGFTRDSFDMFLCTAVHSIFTDSCAAAKGRTDSALKPALNCFVHAVNTISTFRVLGSPLGRPDLVESLFNIIADIIEMICDTAGGAIDFGDLNRCCNTILQSVRQVCLFEGSRAYILSHQRFTAVLARLDHAINNDYMNDSLGLSEFCSDVRTELTRDLSSS